MSVKWRDDESGRIPILSWSEDIEPVARQQAVNLSRHSRTFHHVAIMADCHPGYGMPIGGVIACRNAVIPYAVGVDIGCGMVAVRTGMRTEDLKERLTERIVRDADRRIPTGEGHSHSGKQDWDQFHLLPAWMDGRGLDLALRSLGTLGGGNHFLEIQKGEDGWVWLMIHSGSRNTGYRIARHHHEVAVKSSGKLDPDLPSAELSWLPADSPEGKEYVDDMNFAMDYARENRRRLIEVFIDVFISITGINDFDESVNIHHNFASLENHFGYDVWIHRKGATSAFQGEMGIIPGSMGTPSYIVRGLGNPDSFMSCSHGAGRLMGRREASRKLDLEGCNRAMEKVVFSGWKKYGGYGRRGKGAPRLDLSEAPAAYKDIEKVMDAQKDLVEPVVRLIPAGVVKG